jgi:segregation and condensation protein B
MQSDIKRTVEALLFASPVPLSVNKLRAIVAGSDMKSIRQALEQLRDDYDEGEHAFQLKEIAGGWRVVTREQHALVIEEMLKGQRNVRLSKAALEVLALVSYRQPCTRLEVDDVRGVNSGGSIATLASRGLIRIIGRAESLGRPLLYGTTDEFLSHLGINSIEDLPRLTEIEALLASSEEWSGEDSSEVSQERRLKLVEGMENISEIIREQEPEPVVDLKLEPETEPVTALKLEAKTELEPETETDEEHSRVLRQGLEEERLSLTEPVDIEADIQGDVVAEGEDQEITEIGSNDDPVADKMELAMVTAAGKDDGA